MKGATNHLTAGQRVAYYRRRRGISQAVLADLVGKTTSWVEKIEAGRMPLDVLSNIAALARALDISVYELLPDDIADVDAVTRGRSVPALRELVLSYRFVNPRLSGAQAAPVELPALKAIVADIWQAYQAARFGYVVARLQHALPIAGVTVAQAKPPADEEARTQLAYLYQVACSVLTKLGELDLAMLCADKGDSVIQGVDDLAAQISLQRTIAHALLSNAQYGDALAVIDDAVRRVPHGRLDPRVLSVVGTLHLVGAMASARQGNRAEASSHLAHAGAAAEAVGRDANYLWTSFGPTNVAIHHVSVAAELGDYQQAAALGPGIDTTGMSTERRVRHQLEVARAFHFRAKRGEALRMVLAAEAAAPEQVRRHFLTHALVHEWLRNKQMRPTPELHALAVRTGALPR